MITFAAIKESKGTGKTGGETKATPKRKTAQRKILITSALPYVNNVPHLGNIIGCVLSADVFSRYCRLKAYDALYICGTDEHGTATETKAIEEGLTPQQICDKYYAIHKEIYEWFNISFDIFGRTTTQEHTEITQEIFLKLHKNGYINEAKLQQLFCLKDQKFLADRYVEGECPHCQYPDARGDQCEQCGHLLNAVELISPRCKLCGTTPEVRESEHLFLALDKLEKPLERWVEKQKGQGSWTENAVTTTEKWLREGLKPRCITRDLKWGVSVPFEKYKDKVFYVWFDAPIGYISITKKAREDWKEWWHAKDVLLYQFMAKDNIPFHTILFPASLIGTKDGYTMLHHINSTEYLNYESGKFSKSRGEGVFGDDARSTGIPADCWRYYLLINRPERSDSVFTWKDFRDRINNELVANIGNLVNRTVTFIRNNFDGEVSAVKNRDLDYTKELASIEEAFEKVELKRALQEIMLLSKLGNKYFQEKEPWKLVKTEQEKAKDALANLFLLVRDLSILIWPYLPTTAENIWKQLGLEQQKWADLGTPVQARAIGTPQLLFQKVEDKKIEELQKRFSGKKEADSMHKEAKGKERKQEAIAAGIKDGAIQEGQDETFLNLRLKVAEITDVKDHPSADKLYILQIDIGEEQPRQLVAGLKAYYTKEELLGKRIVVVSNLEPAALRGEKSEGMLLAAGDGKQVGLLLAEKSAPGEVVSVSRLLKMAEEDNVKPSKQVPFTDFQKLALNAGGGKARFNHDILLTATEEITVDKGVEGKVR